MLIEHWIRANLRQLTPRSNALLKLIFSDTEVAGTDPIWLHELIRLMDPFGLDERATRTSVFRLTEQGCLRSRRHGRRACYMVAPENTAALRTAWRELGASPARHWDGNWTLLINSGGRIGAATYATLRKALAHHGYCALAPNVLVRPTDVETGGHEETAWFAGEPNLAIFQVSGHQVTAGRAPREFGAASWDLDSVRQQYAHFRDQAAPLAEALRAGATPTPVQAFVARVLVALAWQQCRAYDPMLPAEFLPEDWPAPAAHALYRDLMGRTLTLARLHARDGAATDQLDTGLPELCARAA